MSHKQRFLKKQWTWIFERMFGRHVNILRIFFQTTKGAWKLKILRFFFKGAKPWFFIFFKEQILLFFQWGHKLKFFKDFFKSAKGGFFKGPKSHKPRFLKKPWTWIFESIFPKASRIYKRKFLRICSKDQTLIL